MIGVVGNEGSKTPVVAAVLSKGEANRSLVTSKDLNCTLNRFIIGIVLWEKRWTKMVSSNLLM